MDTGHAAGAPPVDSGTRRGSLGRSEVSPLSVRALLAFSCESAGHQDIALGGGTRKPEAKNEQDEPENDDESYGRCNGHSLFIPKNRSD